MLKSVSVSKEKPFWSCPSAWVSPLVVFPESSSSKIFLIIELRNLLSFAIVVSSVCWDQLRLGSLSPFLIRCNASYFKGTVFGVNPMTWSCLRRPLLTGEWERRWLWLQRGSSHENARRERHEAPATLDGHLLWMCDWSLGVPGVDWLLRAKTANKIICSLVKPLVSLAAFFVSSRNAPLQQDQNSCEGDYKTSTKPIRQWASFQWTSFKIPAVFTDTLLGWWDKSNVTWFFRGEGAGKTSDKIQQLKKCGRVCLF